MYNNILFHRICGYGHLHVASWLHHTFGLTLSDARAYSNDALYRACHNNRLIIAQWLVRTFGLTAADIIDSTAPFFVCSDGHLPIVKWLVDAYDLEYADLACAGRHTPLSMACSKGHLSIAQWLVAKFDLTDKHISSCNALAEALKFGHQDVVLWLKTRKIRVANV